MNWTDDTLMALVDDELGTVQRVELERALLVDAALKSRVDRDGAYCRTFSTAALAGLACRRGDRWAVQAVAATATTVDGAMRQAATSLPREVLMAVDQRIAGEALDATRERQARDKGGAARLGAAWAASPPMTSAWPATSD